MRLLVSLFLILSFLNANADEAPAKIYLECDDRNSDVVCELKLDVSDGWRIYAHDDANEMFLNIRLDEEQSFGVKDIKIDWSSQRVEYDANTNYYIPNTPIKFSFVSFEDNYRAVLDVNYVACNTYCTSFKEQIIHSGSKSSNLPYMIFLAFFGGLILNFMPCVLPVIFMKFTYISKKSKKDLNAIKKEIITIFLGILCSFFVLAFLTIVAKSFGKAAGWGLHFQQPFFIGFLSVITGVAAMNLLGVVNFETPKFIQRFLDRFDSNGFLSDFLHGVFVVLLATPCTAPFLTTAVAFCLSQDSKTILLIYSAIGLGLGFPYIIIALFPKAMKVLPKPGSWMEKFKFIAAIPFTLTAAWLLYVLLHQVSIYYVIGLFYLLVSLPIILRKSKLGIILMVILVIGSFKLTEELELDDRIELQKIHEDIEAEKTVIVNVTAKWCITCKVNDKFIFNNKDIIEKLEARGIVLAIIDYTNQSDEIDEFIKKNKRSGIPLTIVYGPNAKDGIILPVIFSKDDLFKAIEKAKKM